MAYFILSLVLIFICRFIYDSFLTNNTEKNWERYKQGNPHKAIAVENSKGLNMNPNAEIRTDGNYIGKYNGNDYNGNPITIYYLLFFTKSKFVCFGEILDIEEWKSVNKETMKESINEINMITDLKISQSIANYMILNGGISMKFFEPNENENRDNRNPKIYDEWYGSIIHNGLILSYDRAYFNFALQVYTKENMFKNLRFEFTQI